MWRRVSSNHGLGELLQHRKDSQSYLIFIAAGGFLSRLSWVCISVQWVRVCLRKHHTGVNKDELQLAFKPELMKSECRSDCLGVHSKLAPGGGGGAKAFKQGAY